MLVRALAQSGLSELSVTAAHAVRVARLPSIHRDPFDRLLVAQSLAEPMTLLTNDAALVRYGSQVQLVQRRASGTAAPGRGAALTCVLPFGTVKCRIQGIPLRSRPDDCQSPFRPEDGC